MAGPSFGPDVGDERITARMGNVSSPGDTLTVASLVVDTTADSATVNGQNTLREAIGLANYVPGNNAITFDPTVFAAPQTITLERHAARAQRHHRNRDDYRPGCGRNDQRQQREPSVPG